MHESRRTPSSVSASRLPAESVIASDALVSVSSLGLPPLGIEVVELEDRQQRKLDALRAHIDTLLSEHWTIASRSPLTLRRGKQMCYVLHGMLISDRFI